MSFEKRTKFLGVDPSFANMGLALHDPTAGTLQLFTGEYKEGIRWLNRSVKLSEIMAIIENPNLDKATFVYPMIKNAMLDLQEYARWTGSRKGMPPKKVTIEDVMSQVYRGMNYAQAVGKNKAAASQILNDLRGAGVPCMEVAPSKRQRADKLPKLGKAKVVISTLTMPTKTNKQQFKELTGYSDPTSEHARDAATLVWGRTLRSAYLHFARIAEVDGEPDPTLIYLVQGRKPMPAKEKKLPF